MSQIDEKRFNEAILKMFEEVYGVHFGNVEEVVNYYIQKKQLIPKQHWLQVDI